MVTVARLNANEARERLRELAEVLFDCVEGGASVSFMPPFSHDDAAAFFTKVIEGPVSIVECKYAAGSRDRVYIAIT